MSYTALYRKYRPSRFSDVLGQDGVVRTILNQLKGGKVSHAYLFCGTRGTGKTSMAKIFAKAINCAAPVDGEPCGACVSCAELASERSMNVIEIDAASNNGVENIRELREEVRYTPATGTHKVYIIDEVHMLSPGAYGALLKTLEEPPAHVVFILATTDPQKIPVTIHSRCQRFDFRRIPQSLIAGRLTYCLVNEGIEADEDALSYVASLSDGSMRDALSLLDRCVSFFPGERITLEGVLEVTGSIDARSFFELTECLNGLDAPGALALSNEIIMSGKDVSRVTLDALSHFRRLIVAKTTEAPAKILDLPDEYAARLKEQAAATEELRIMSYIEAFSSLNAALRYSPDPRVLLEIELIKLCRPEIINSNSYEEIYSKLYALEKRLDKAAAYFSSAALEKSGGVKEQANTVREQAAQKAARRDKEQPVTVALPGGLSEFKERFGEIKACLKNNRAAHAFAGALDRAEPGFLDEKHVYIIFEDETNESLLKDERRLEMLERAAESVTGRRFSIKTITRDKFKSASAGVRVTEPARAGGLLERAGEIFGEFDAK